MTVTPPLTAVRTSTRPRLFTPGPVEIPVRILRALSQVPPHHRTEVFRETYKRVSDDLRWVHQTQGEVLMLAASGTGAMEAAVVNLMEPGKKALCLIGGKFGERWANICKAYGVPYEVIETPWGHAVPVSDVERRLDDDPKISTVFGTHSETSTATLHDAHALAKATRARSRRIVLDAITSLGVHPLPQDEWGVDVVVTGSQKGLMSPPGSATVSLAPWALDAIEGERQPRFYWDLRKARKNLPSGESAFTPAVSLVFAVGEALTMMKEEGLANVHARHARLERGDQAAPRHPRHHRRGRTGPYEGQDAPHRPHGRLRPLRRLRDPRRARGMHGGAGAEGLGCGRGGAARVGIGVRESA